ncbi:hypothetical protein BB558_003391 [Smittium angustum]|uniref:beta-glucosidase n=1 Tax=Smittium angustum TaxID=133377 RepID=A0A2U1J656_SMIAN|nr:hypothetical protein BB558_003391 [Smittium angustum]
MIADNITFLNDTINLVKNGMIPESRIEESTDIILQLKKYLGLFKQPFSDSALIGTVVSAQGVEVERKTARKSIILYQNKNNSFHLISGWGWNVHCDGPSKVGGNAVATDMRIKSCLLSIKSKENQLDGFGKKTTEIPEDTNTLNIPKNQNELVKRITYETIPESVDGIINSRLPGAYGGLPIAKMLYGKFSLVASATTYSKIDYQTKVTKYTEINISHSLLLDQDLDTKVSHTQISVLVVKN